MFYPCERLKTNLEAYELERRKYWLEMRITLCKETDEDEYSRYISRKGISISCN